MTEQKIEVDTNSTELRSLIYDSEDEFVNKYRQLDKSNAANVYSRVTTKIVDMIAGDNNLNSFKEYLKHTGYVNDLEDENTLSIFRRNIDTRLSQSNLIILVCKHGRADLLEHLFDKSVPVLRNNYFSNQRSLIKPGDKDENCHNAFYYAIRSGKTKLVKLLLDSWLFQQDLKELHETLAESYEELTLKNVKLSDEMIVFVEERLISSRFYSESSNDLKNLGNSHDIKERIDLVVDNIRLLRTEFLNDIGLDEKFFVRARYIVQNLNILKRYMRLTYNTLPWEEIEFCLITFIQSQQRGDRTKLSIFDFYSTPKKLFNYLDTFSRRLTDEAKLIQKISISILSNFPPIKRDDTIANIITMTPEFKELYQDYSKLRDTYSLATISKYLNRALFFASGKQGKVLMFSRTLQVIGEQLKNTWESPNMSKLMNQLLITSVSKDMRKIIMNLRDSMSLSYCFKLKQEFEINCHCNKEFLENFEKDFDMLNSIISNLLNVTQTQHIVKVLKTVSSSKTVNVMKKSLEIFDLNVNVCWFEQRKKCQSLQDFKHLKELFDDFSKAISKKTDLENSLFCRLKDVSEMHQITQFDKFNYDIKLTILQNFRACINIENINETNLQQIVYFVQTVLEVMPQNNTFDKLQKLISKLFLDYILSYEPKIISFKDYEHFVPIINRIFTQLGFGIHDLQWLEELREVLYENKLFKKSYENNVSNISLEEEISPEDLDEIYSTKLITLKKIIEINYEFDRNLTAYRTNKNLQVAIETVLFDVMFILNSWERFVDNDLQYDAAAPLLVGKNLFNFLAHNDAFYDVQLYDSAIAIFFNANKFTINIDMNKKIGIIVPNNFAKLKWKFNQDLTNVINQEAMFKAIEQSDYEKMKKTSTEGAEFFARSHRNWTALHFAVKESSCKMVEFILDQKVNANIGDIDGISPLHLAVKFKRIDVVKFLIEKKIISINIITNYEETPLHTAALNGYKEIVQVLLKNNGDTSLKNCGTHSPIHYATINGSKEIVSMLLEKEKGVDHNKLSSKETILHLAAELGHVELVKYLVDLKSNVNHKNKYHKVPLFNACLNGHLEVVKILVSNNANIYERSTDRFSPLTNAVQSGSTEIVKILLERRQKLKISDSHSDSMVMHLAAMFGHIDIIKLLLSYKLPFDAEDSVGMTPLHNAVLKGHLEIVKILIQHNARVNFRNVKNSTPLITACINGYEKIVEILLKTGLSCTSVPSPLHVSAIHGKKEVIKVLSAHGDDLNWKDIFGRTALHFCSGFGHEDIVKFLLEKGVGLNTKDHDGFTPLHHAANSGHEKIVEMLIKAGAHVNVKSSIRSTALHASALKGHFKIVDHLINAKAQLNIKDNKYETTPLYLAVENNHLKIAKSLLDHKAPINIKDNKNRTLLFIACLYNWSEMFELLIRYGANVAAEKTKLLEQAIFLGHKNIVKVLLEKNIIKIDAVVSTGLPILHQSAMFNHSDVVELLLANKAKVNALNFLGSALMVAAIENQTNAIKVLLKYHADPDLYPQVRTTEEASPSAIQGVVMKGHLESLKLMFKYSKKDIDNKDANGFTLLHIAASSGYLDIVKYLIAKGANINITTAKGKKSIHLAAQNNYQSIVEYFFSINVDINDVDHRGWTSLHHAVYNNHRDLVEYLIQQKIDVNVKTAVGSSALHSAVQLGHDDIVEILLKNGAAYNIKNNKKKEPKQDTSNAKIIRLFKSVENLFDSVTQNNSAKCQEYLKQGAIVNAVNDDLCTSLHYACWKGFIDITTILLSNNANPNVFTKNGSTPLHYAAKFTNFNIVKSLLSYGGIYNAKTKKGNKPLDLASSQEIIEFLSLIQKLFNKVENDDTSVIDDLSKIKDHQILKTIFAAQNEKKETLITAAINNDFSKIEKLKHGFVTDSALYAEKALKLVKQGEYSKALIVYMELYYKHTEVLGPENPGTLEALMEVGDTYAHLNQFTEALSIFSSIHKIHVKIFSFDHKVTLNSRSLIGRTSHQLGRCDEALAICKNTYDTQRKILDKYDNSLLSSLSNLAMVMFDFNLYVKSLQIQNELLERYKIILGDTHPSIIIATNSIGLTLAKLGRYEEALEVIQKAYKLRKKLSGPDHPDTLRIIYNQIEVFMDQEKFDQALDSCKRLLDSQEKVLGANHLDTWRTKVRLGDIYFQQDKFTDALKNFTETIKKMKMVLKPDDPTVVSLSNKIKKVMEVMKMFGIRLEPESLEVCIADAARSENSVKHFIENGFDINSKDDIGFSLLHYATSNGNLNVVKFLLKNGADYSLLSKKGNTSLHLAVLKKNTHVVNFLLQYVKKTNSKGLPSFINAKTTSSGMTCLHVASRNGSEEIVRSLLKYGAMYDPQDLIDGKKPREMSQNKNIVKLLTILDELFNDLKNDKNALKSKLKNLSPTDFAVIINARNGNNDTLS